MTNRFRSQYVELSDESKGLVDELKTLAEAMETLLKTYPAGREANLAITKLEEAVMWGTKHLTSAEFQ